MRTTPLVVLALAAATSSQGVVHLPTSPETNSESAGFEFHQPELLKAGGEPILVESPGYAAPALHDIDGDGDLDLIVGQFRGGKMQIFERNDDGALEAGRWLEADGDVAIVPGVW